MDWAHDLHDADTVRRARAAVSMDEPWQLIERFARLIRESGSDDERTAARYLRERLESFGIEPAVYEPELYLSVPRTCSLTVLGGEPEDLECKVPAFARSTDGLEGELVAVTTAAIRGTGDLFRSGADIEPGRVRGKIVLADGYAMPKVVGQLQRAGAAGAIFVNPGHAHEGIITDIWGTPALGERHRIPDFTALAVPKAAGDVLRARLAAGSCRVRITADLFQGWAACPVVVADIPGGGDDFVLIHGHYDSWHEGIGDNAVGDAALLEVARVAHRVRDRLARGVRVVWWPAHSTGRYGGSTWFADHFAMELRDHCVAQIDVDSPGCRWATAYDEVMWMAEAEGLARRAIRAGAGAEATGMRPLRAGDYSFNQIGLTGFFMLLSNIPEQVAREKGFYPVGGCGGNSDAWHTEGDTLAVADRDNLERDIHVYVEAVIRLATTPFLPFDYRATVAEIEEAVREYAAAAKGAFDVEPVLEECRCLRSALDSFYRAAEDAVRECGDADRPPEVWPLLHSYDRLQLALARELVPVAYCRRRYYHDPALETPAVPDLAPLRDWESLADDRDGRGFLLAELTRGRNRVVDGLKRARERLRSVSGGSLT